MDGGEKLIFSPPLRLRVMRGGVMAIDGGNSCRPLLKRGDFVQLVNHKLGVFFELEAPVWGEHCVASFVKYQDGLREPGLERGCGIRSAVSAEMAIPVMQFKGQRFHSKTSRPDE